MIKLLDIIESVLSGTITFLEWVEEINDRLIGCLMRLNRKVVVRIYREEDIR